MNKNWTVLLIHHSHTDVGYTDSQTRIARFHIGFLDQVIETARKIREGDASLAGFRWTSECFWSVEQWLRARPAERHEELVRCIREGVIELSATYLHFSELIDEGMMRTAIGRARSFAQQYDLPLDSAVSADINGLGWGYAQVLHDAGIRNLVTCVHPHHGLAPIGRRQLPFFWETPGGQEILVWNGEHYNLGNIMGLCPGAGLNYSFQDELNLPHREMDTMPFALKRLPRYLRQLEADGYPYDFVPLHISGATTDNAPPSEAVIRFANQWNATYPGSIRLEMSTLSELCRRAREHSEPIPQYRGDWPDWWSDGLSSLPSEVRLARAGMRTYRHLKDHAVKAKTLTPTEAENIEDNLLLFCEHTFSHSASMKAPWDIDVAAIGGNKRAFGCAGYDAALTMRDALLEVHGQLPSMAPVDAGDRFFYKIYNPLGVPVTDLAALYVDSIDHDVIQIDATAVDITSGEILKTQKSSAHRGVSYNVPVTIEAGGHAVIELIEGNSTLRFAERHVGGENENTPPDVEGAGASGDAHSIETAFLRLSLCNDEGIVELTDLESGMSLLAANRDHAPFVPVYEVTPADGSDANAMRRAREFGRNRKGENVRRNAGTLRSIRRGKAGAIWIPVELDYESAGASFYKVNLSIWRSLPRIDVAIRIHKSSVWEPENLYLSLPFAVPGGEMWLDKAGVPIRPWQDQLPDTLTDWFSIQEGFVSCNDTLGIAVAIPDAPLLQLGPLAYGPRKLMGHPRLDIREARPYSWLMTNYWETNFHASLGGFHEFRYRVEFGKHLVQPVRALEQCAALNHGLQTFRIRPSA